MYGKRRLIEGRENGIQRSFGHGQKRKQEKKAPKESGFGLFNIIFGESGKNINNYFMMNHQN